MQSEVLRRTRQFCAQADVFPSQEILKYLSDSHFITYVRFCSVPDSDGSLPAPQLIKHGQAWRGGVLVFMHNGKKNGMPQKKWEAIADSVMMRPVYFESAMKYLWKAASSQWPKDDPRITELQENYQRLKFAPDSNQGYMSPTELVEAAQEQQEERAAVTDQAVQRCEAVEVAATDAASAGPVSPKAARLFKKTSLKATLAYVERKVQHDSEACIADQPDCKKARRSAARSLKSKNPKHVAKTRAKEERRARRAAIAAVAAGGKLVPAVAAVAAGGAPKSELVPGQSASGQQQPDKPRKTVTFALPDAADSRPPALNLAQRVVHRALPQPPGQEWKYAVAELFQSPYAYAPGSRRGGAAVATLKKLLAEVGATSVFFDTRNAEGLGLLFPTRESQSNPAFPSTLELHRCALSLEKAAEDLLRACVARVGEDCSAAARLSPADAADLQFAWSARGGIAGHGQAYWPAELDAGLFPLEALAQGASSSIADTVRQLRANRTSAFRRRYLICDELTWCLPYLAKLYFLRSKSPAMSAGQLRATYQTMTGYRLCAIRADAAPLLDYARGVQAYAARLAEVAGNLGLALDAAAVPASAAAVLARAPTATAQDAEVIRCRIAEEDRDAKAIQHDLGLQSSPALKAAVKLRAALVRAMQSDSHQRAATRHLHASPSLPQAVYDPQRYLRSSAGSSGCPPDNL